jgi:hypothetical protein
MKELDDLFAAYEAESTPANRLALERALDKFETDLPKAVGHDLAFRYNGAFAQWKDAADRYERTIAAMANRTPLDDSDRQVLNEIMERHDAALNRFHAVEAEVMTALRGK